MKLNSILTRTFPIVSGFVVFLFYVWLAFHSSGYDWSVSELFGEIVSTSGSNFPYFSYFYNGGVYLAHDPQAWVTSPLFRIFVSLTDPIAGARWLGVAYGVLGFFSTYAWLRSQFSKSISLYGALAFSLSLGMFWRLVAGHTLFLLEMMLPFFLLAIFKIENARTRTHRFIWILGTAIVGAWVIYEPGFHALFYFIFPGLFFEMFLRFFLQPKATFKLLPSLGLAGALAGAMILPKIMAWGSLAMTRTPDLTDGTLALKDVLLALFMTARSSVMGFHVPGSNPERWHFIFEVNTALMPVASLLALLGIGFVFWKQKIREKTVLLGFACLIFSILVAANPFVWRIVQSMTSGGIRVPSRFLALGAFGLMILSIYGLLAVSIKFQRHRVWIVMGVSLLVLILGGNWLYRAQKSETLQSDLIKSRVVPELKAQFRFGKYCPVASGCLNTYQIGYAEDPYIRYLSDQRITEENFVLHLRKDTIVRPTSITLSSIRPGEVIDLPFRPASFGHEIRMVPSGLFPKVETVQGHLRVYGDPNQTLERMEIIPGFPAPSWSLWFSGFTALISAISFVVLLFFTAKHSECPTHPSGSTPRRSGKESIDLADD